MSSDILSSLASPFALEIGTVNTVFHDSNASATIRTDASSGKRYLDLRIPRGPPGPQGLDGMSGKDGRCGVHEPMDLVCKRGVKHFIESFSIVHLQNIHRIVFRMEPVEKYLLSGIIETFTITISPRIKTHFTAEELCRSNGVTAELVIQIVSPTNSILHEWDVLEQPTVKLPLQSRTKDCYFEFSIYCPSQYNPLSLSVDVAFIMENTDVQSVVCGKEFFQLPLNRLFQVPEFRFEPAFRKLRVEVSESKSEFEPLPTRTKETGISLDSSDLAATPVSLVKDKGAKITFRDRVWELSPEASKQFGILESNLFVTEEDGCPLDSLVPEQLFCPEEAISHLVAVATDPETVAESEFRRWLLVPGFLALLIKLDFLEPKQNRLIGYMLEHLRRINDWNDVIGALMLLKQLGRENGF